MRARGGALVRGIAALVVSGTLAAFTALAAGDAGAQPARRPEAAKLMNELMSGTAPVGGPFTLRDPAGKPRSLAEFRGRVVLLYFGYTFCPDACPTDLANVAKLLKRLGPDAGLVQAIFITVDPERDTAAVLAPYAAAFDPNLLALRGTPQETRRVATAYKTYFEKVRRAGKKDYLVDHTSFTYLLDREGKYVAFFPPGTLPDRMEVMVREALAR